MAYTEVPENSNEQFLVSQPKIKTNFLAIQTSFAVDHEAFDAPLDGKHKMVTLTEQAADPNQIAEDQATVFSKLSTVTAETGLFWQKEGTGAAAGNTIEMTAAVQAASGYTMLPSGVKICWGNGHISVGSYGSAAIVFDSAFSTAPYSVQLTPFNAQPASSSAGDFVGSVTNLTANQFTVSRRAGQTGFIYYFYYMAIGV